MASKADLIFSIGPKIHQYFQNAYRADYDGKHLSEIPHEEILPIPVICQLGKDPQEGDTQQHHILNMCFYGLEAMVSGLPTAVYENSHLAHFIIEHFEDHADYSIVRSPEENLSDTIVKHLKNTAVAFKKAKQLKTDLVNSEVISTSYARFATLLTTPVQQQSGDDSEYQGAEKDEKESLDVQIDLDNHVYDQHLKEVEEELKALPAQLKKEQIEEMITKLKSAWRDCKKAQKRRVEEVVADEDGLGDIKTLIMKILGDEVDAKSLREKSLAILLRLLTLYNLYRVKQTCRSRSMAKAFEPLLITDEMRDIAAEVGIKLQLKATYNPERFKELELRWWWNSMKFYDILTEDSDEDVQMSSNKAEETGYIEDNVTEISVDDLKEGKDPSKLLLLEIDPALEIKSSTETSVQTMFKAEKCIRLKGRQCDMLQVLTTNTDTVQHILSCRQDVLALLGVTRYLLTDAPTQDMDTQEMQLQFIRNVLSNSNSLTLPVSDANVSLLARSLLPCQISQVQITECIVELSARINEKERDLQKSVLKHQLDEAKQEKANLVEHIRKLTQTIDITEKELTKHVGNESVYEKLSSELEEKEKIISDLEAKLSALEEIQSELELQGKAEIKVGSQYSGDERGIKDQDVIGTKLDYASSKTDNEEDKTMQQSTTVREGSEMETATSSQPEMTVREGSEIETATPSVPSQPAMTVREGSEMETATHHQCHHNLRWTVREGNMFTM
ncbi:putative leucine-rich repeat-containing protein DDB_G0290503 [Ptychodera flava]|uniref:putative leucine-rich repeat-containing protein DDB_G0290503 n=1 Tax=Ptychodera flava TaxID=63121 RepID=UPI003969F7E5